MFEDRMLSIPVQKTQIHLSNDTKHTYTESPPKHKQHANNNLKPKHPHKKISNASQTEPTIHTITKTIQCT